MAGFPENNALLPAPLHTETGTDLARAIQLLEAGEVVAIPTETVYGLAANALSETAVLKIFEAKKRPQFNPLIVHFANTEAAFSAVENIPEIARRLAQEFWPGPLTLLLPKKKHIPDLVTAGSDRVAVRVSAHPLFRKLLAALTFPLAAPSANLFTTISPTTATHVAKGLDGRIPYILDGGPSHVGLESTIIGFPAGEKPVLYRAGGISREVLEDFLGMPLLLQNKPEEHPVAPGQLRSHYAPAAPLYFGDSFPELMRQAGTGDVAIIAFQQRISGNFPQFLLSPTGDLNEAARNLFTALHWANNQPVAAILAGAVPEKGLGVAINDRLRRASVNFEY